jgi:hypothetical protein
VKDEKGLFLQRAREHLLGRFKVGPRVAENRKTKSGRRDAIRLHGSLKRFVFLGGRNRGEYGQVQIRGRRISFVVCGNPRRKQERQKKQSYFPRAPDYHDYSHVRTILHNFKP